MQLTYAVLQTLPQGKPEKRGKERRYRCPRCWFWNPNEADRTLGVDRDTGEAHCWFCHWAPYIADFPRKKSTYLPAPVHQDPELPLAEVPEVGIQWLERRGLDGPGTVRRYQIRWDGRLCWPCGEGWAKRTIVDGVHPKVRISCEPSQGALLGACRLHPGANVVLNEGDCKAASIPFPWIGCATIGTKIHDLQAQRIVLSRPAGVWIMQDGGVQVDIPQDFRLAQIPVYMVEGLPPGKGPDDVQMVERIRLLLNARRV